MRFRPIILSVVILIFASAALAQVTPEEAAKRLHERQVARQAERDKAITIKQGDLDDMRAEIAKLKAEVASLKSQQKTSLVAAPTTSPSAPRFVLKIVKGVTREQLFTFVLQRKDHYRIAKDVRGADKQELITLERFKIEKTVVGQRFDGVQNVDLVKDEKKTMNSWSLSLANDTITDISGEDPPVQID